MMDEIVIELARAAKEIVKILKRVINPDEFTIGINDGKEAGQEIPHLHLNVISRFKGDVGEPMQYMVHNPSIETISDTAKKIRQDP